MVAVKLDGLVDCCGDRVERKWIFVGSEFCEEEVVDWCFWLRYDFVDFSGKIGGVLEVELLDFCRERSRCC